MRTLQVNLPDGLEINEFELSMILASRLYETGKLSSGQAAEMVGVSKRTFIELLGIYGVSVFSDEIADLKMDIENAIKN